MLLLGRWVRGYSLLQGFKDPLQLGFNLVVDLLAVRNQLKGTGLQPQDFQFGITNHTVCITCSTPPSIEITKLVPFQYSAQGLAADMLAASLIPK